MTIYISTPLIRERDNTKIPPFAVVNDAGAAVDISSATITYMVLDSNNVVKITKTFGTGVTITNGPGGLFTVTLDASDSAGLAAGQYIDKVVLNISGVKETLFVRPVVYR